MPLARCKLGTQNTPQPWRPPSPYGLHGAPPLAVLHTTIGQHDEQQFYVMDVILFTAAVIATIAAAVSVAVMAVITIIIIAVVIIITILVITTCWLLYASAVAATHRCHYCRPCYCCSVYYK